MLKNNFILLLSFALLACLALAGPANAEVNNLANQPVFYQSAKTDKCHSLDTDHSQWPQIRLSELQEGHYYCWRIPVTISHSDNPQALQLWSAMLASSSTYWNGEFVGRSGIPGESLSEEVAGPIFNHFPLSIQQLKPGKHLLSMEVSTFHHEQDLHSIFYLMMLIDQQSLDEFKQSNLLLPLVLCGALWLLTLFFQLLYWRYQKQSTYLLFSLLCLSASLVIVLEVAKFTVSYPWDWHVTRLKVIIFANIITTVLLIAFYLDYFNLRKKSYWHAAIIIQVVLAGYFGPSYDAKSALIFLIGFLGALAISLLAIKLKRRGALVNSSLLTGGVLLLIILPSRFIENWFALFFAFIALLNLYNLTNRIAEERQRALLTLKLETEMLRRSLQPHFLMNSLLLIVEWVETQPKLAIEFIESLAEEFRLLNTMSKQIRVPVEQEIRLCQMHLAIMSRRYQQDYQLVVDNQVGEFELPPAILHTLIENAFSHSRVSSERQFSMQFSREKSNVCLLIKTPNQWAGNSEQLSHGKVYDSLGTGTGERYIKQRLHESYDRDYEYSSAQVEAYWQTRICFPANVGMDSATDTRLFKGSDFEEAEL